MPVYQPLVPSGTVDLNVDYQALQDNFNQANIVYGTDHYPLDNATPNQGFHNLVTTPPVVNVPPNALPPATAAGICKFYAYPQYSAIGLQQWSRGPSNAVPTPVTNIYGGPISLANLATTNIMDFVGFTRITCMVPAFNDDPTTKSPVNGFVVFSQGNFEIVSPTSGLRVQNSGTVLQLRNISGVTLSNIYWTLQFSRVE